MLSTFKALKYFRIFHGDRRVFSIARHYFFQCSNYTFQRETMLEKISQLIPPETRIDYELLVSESFTLPPEINMKICRSVLLYINETSRFGM